MEEIMQDLAAAYDALKRAESLLGQGRTAERLAVAGKHRGGRAFLATLAAAERAVAFARGQVEAARGEAFDVATH